MLKNKTLETIANKNINTKDIPQLLLINKNTENNIKKVIGDFLNEYNQRNIRQDCEIYYYIIIEEINTKTHKNVINMVYINELNCDYFITKYKNFMNCIPFTGVYKADTVHIIHGIPKKVHNTITSTETTKKLSICKKLWETQSIPSIQSKENKIIDINSDYITNTNQLINEIYNDYKSGINIWGLRITAEAFRGRNMGGFINGFGGFGNEELYNDDMEFDNNEFGGF